MHICTTAFLSASYHTVDSNKGTRYDEFLKIAHNAPDIRSLYRELNFAAFDVKPTSPFFTKGEHSSVSISQVGSGNSDRLNFVTEDIGHGVIITGIDGNEHTRNRVV
jgi:hypothetical protein